MGGPQGRPSETEEDEQEFQEEIARAPVWIAEQQQIGSAHTAAPPEPEIIALNSFNDEAKSFLLRAALDTLVSLGKLQAMAGGGMVAQLTGQNKADIVELAEALDPVGTVFEYGTRAALDEYGLAGGAYEYLPLMVGMIGSVGTAAFTGGQAGTGGAAVKGGKLAALVGRNADDIVAILAREMKSPDFIREYIKRTSPEEYAELVTVMARRLKAQVFGEAGHLISPADADVILKKAAPVADEMTQAGYRSVTAGGDVAIGLGEGAARTGAPPGTAAAAADVAAEAGGVAGKFAGPEWAGSITVTGRAVKNIAGRLGRIHAQDPNLQRLLDDGADIIFDRNW
ncbi:MAG: hypothetical protein QGH66_09620, partial [Dehalococcoidia bacterium]|nr:hypothetical protein [Dehalococcoidia bacterium]